MKDLMQDLARRAVEQSDRAWESRIPQLVQSVRQEVMAEIDAKLCARDEQVQQKFTALQAQFGASDSSMNDPESRSQLTGVKEVLVRVESKVDSLTAEHEDTKAGLTALKSEFAVLKDPTSQGARLAVGHTGADHPVSRGSQPGMSSNTHRADAEIAKGELILTDFGGPLTRDSIVEAYKAWAEVHLPEATPLPTFKSRRIDGSAKLVFQSSSQAKTVLDAHIATEGDGNGISHCGQKFRMKPSRPFRQRRLNDHMGGVKYKISNLGAGDILRSLNLEQDKWQWEASFERGFASGGKLHYLLNGRPQIVARLALDKDGGGKLSSNDNVTAVLHQQLLFRLSRF